MPNSKSDYACYYLFRLTGIGVMTGAGLNICTVEGLDIGSIDDIVGCQKSRPLLNILIFLMCLSMSYQVIFIYLFSAPFQIK